MTRRMLLVLLWLPASVSAIGNTSCHIHPPGSTPQDPLNTVGPFDSVSECESQRRLQFGNTGYCHCSADFTPDWQRLDPGKNLPENQPLI